MAQKILTEPPSGLAKQYPLLYPWLVQVFSRINDQLQVLWSQIDKTGSSISDIENNSHSLLSDLALDNHTQYHTDARGDSRYYTQSLLDAGQLDTRYYTRSQSDATFVDFTDLASTTSTGIVMMSASVTNAVSSTVSVTSADATDLATVITLANELKSDVNTLISDLNSTITQLNALLAANRTSGQLQP